MSHWMLDPVERQAVMANAATNSILEEYPVIVEVACANSSDELLQVKKVYHVLYQRSLEEDVAANSAGNLRCVCLQYLFSSSFLSLATYIYIRLIYCIRTLSPSAFACACKHLQVPRRRRCRLEVSEIRGEDCPRGYKKWHDG
jgi:hypothetical protein